MKDNIRADLRDVRLSTLNNMTLTSLILVILPQQRKIGMMQEQKLPLLLQLLRSERCVIVAFLLLYLNNNYYNLQMQEKSNTQISETGS